MGVLDRLAGSMEKDRIKREHEKVTVALEDAQGRFFKAVRRLEEVLDKTLNGVKCGARHQPTDPRIQREIPDLIKKV